MTLSETAPLRPADDDEIVDTEACCAVSPVPAATRSPVVRRAVLASAVMLALAGSVFAARDRFHAPEKKARDLHAFKGLMQGGDSSQCNYVCESDADCNSLTGPCVYCSGKGSGSGGTCVSDEDDTGGTGLAGDDDTTKPSAALPAEVTSATKSFAEAVTPKKKYDVLMNAWQCNYVCESDADCNSLTGPCVYCSAKGSGSSGSCVSDEDDTGGTGLAGDDDTTKPSALSAEADDDTTKTNEEWHEHKHSSKCVSDSDCSSEYTCEQGQCMTYQPDAK